MMRPVKTIAPEGNWATRIEAGAFSSEAGLASRKENLSKNKVNILGRVGDLARASALSDQVASPDRKKFAPIQKLGKHVLVGNAGPLFRDML